MKLDDAGIPIRTYGFRRNLIKPKPAVPKLVEVYFGKCKHKEMVRMWFLGQPDADGVYRTRKPFEQCPDCERFDAEWIETVPKRSTGGNTK